MLVLQQTVQLSYFSCCHTYYSSSFHYTCVFIFWVSENSSAKICKSSACKVWGFAYKRWKFSTSALLIVQNIREEMGSKEMKCVIICKLLQLLNNTKAIRDKDKEATHEGYPSLGGCGCCLHYPVMMLLIDVYSFSQYRIWTQTYIKSQVSVAHD